MTPLLTVAHTRISIKESGPLPNKAIVVLPVSEAFHVTPEM